MPPLRLEKFASVLSGLTEEILKLNEAIPKILDIKTEVLNTADTVRQMRGEVSDLKARFICAVHGMEEASKEVVRRDSVSIDDIMSLRCDMIFNNDKKWDENMNQDLVRQEKQGMGSDETVLLGASLAGPSNTRNDEVINEQMTNYNMDTTKHSFVDAVKNGNMNDREGKQAKGFIHDYD